MKPNDTQTVHHISNTVEEDVKMSIDQASLVHIMTLLTDLYEDPRMAVVREYGTNAYDSNIEAGNPVPVLVDLPTRENPNLSVTDYGVGLNVGDIKRVYSLYGASTKRDSNLVNGMLGLGCKSGLTYALSFNVTAIKGGVKTNAMVTKDSDGVGTIKILDTVGTNEPNGVKVTIPIQSLHIDSFREKAQQFYRYWAEGTVLLDGKEPDRSFLDNAVWVDPDIAVIKDYGQSKIVMGNVAYPWDHRNEFQHSIIATVPIGSVDFTPSREAMHQTEQTKATLKEVMRFVTERFPAALSAKVDEADTPFARAKVLNDWRYVSSATTKGALNKYKDALAINYDSRERIVWLWDSYQQVASKVRPDWRYLVNEQTVLVVTEFPFKSVSVSHRSRLHKILEWITDGKPVPRQALIVPEGSTTAVLEGRDNVLCWDDLVALTPAPPKAVRATGTQRTAKYTVTQNNKTFEADELDPNDGPIVWRRRLDPRSWNSEDHWAQLFTEAQVVKLYERQIEKFQKLHPTAVNIAQYRDAEMKKAKKALTKDDKECIGSKERPWDGLHNAGVLQACQDPDIKKILRLRKNFSESKTLQRARILDVAPTDEGKVYDVVKKRYPLLTVIPYPDKNVKDELISYVNDKYNKLKATNGGTN